MNLFICTGKVVAKPELKYIGDKQTATCRFKVAIPRFKKFDGQPTADFADIVAYGKQAENHTKFLDKGSPVNLVGSYQTSSYEGQNGKVYIKQFVAQSVEYLPNPKKDKKENESAEPNNNFDINENPFEDKPSSNNSNNKIEDDPFFNSSNITVDDDELPF